MIASPDRQFEELAETIRPRGVQVFFGALDPAKLTRRDRLVRRIPAVADLMPEGDFRNWAAIDAWATQIAPELHSTAQAGT